MDPDIPSQILIERAQAGNAAALDALFRRHYDELRAFVRLRLAPELRAKESASDILQSACREALEGLERFEYRGEHSFKAWLFGSTLNKVREKARFWRAQKRDIARDTAWPRAREAEGLARSYAALATPSTELRALEAVRRVEAAFDRLSAEDREVITLARFAGLPHAEIARQLGSTEGAIRVRMSRALVRLSRILEEMESES